MKFLVLMSDNRPLADTFHSADYNSLVSAINIEYCKKHNYDFVYLKPFLQQKEKVVINNCIDPHSGAPRHAAWSKILSLHRVLSETMDKNTYDYVVYIDSDCIFKDWDGRLEEITSRHTECDVLITNDAPECDTRACTGFIISKPSQYSLDFFKDWYNVNVPERNTKRCWEQDGLLGIIHNYKRVQLIDNFNFLNEQSGQYLRHITTFAYCVSPENKRVPYFRKFIDSRTINYTQNIKDIQVLEFDTIQYMHQMNSK